MKQLQKGFTTLEMLLVLIILAIVGFTGYYVYHSKQQADKTLNAAQSENTSAPKAPAVKTFADCQKAAGSITQQSYPEVCVTKSGQKFTQPTVYLDIKEWGVKIPLSSSISDATFADANEDTPVASQVGLSLESLKDTLCKAGAAAPAIYFRYTATDTDPVSGELMTKENGSDHKIGNYYYAYEDGDGVSQRNGCQSTSDNQKKADAAAVAFKSALLQIQAD